MNAYNIYARRTVMKIRPLHDWALIKRHEAHSMTSGGIVIPEIAQDEPLEGTIIAIGPGRYQTAKKPGGKTFVPTALQPGQRVVFMEYATRDVVINGEEITFIREEDIVGTVEVPHHVTVRSTFPLEEKKKGPLVPTGKSPKGKPPAVKKSPGGKPPKKTAKKKLPSAPKKRGKR